MHIPQELTSIIESFEHCDAHAVITDGSGKIVYANEAAERHTGFPREEMIGKKPGDLWGGGHAEGIL